MSNSNEQGGREARARGPRGAGAVALAGRAARHRSRPRDHEVDHQEELALEPEDDPLAETLGADQSPPVRLDERRIHTTQEKGAMEVHRSEALPDNQVAQPFHVNLDVGKLWHEFGVPWKPERSQWTLHTRAIAEPLY